jgi:hypothetical protein
MVNQDHDVKSPVSDENVESSHEIQPDVTGRTAGIERGPEDQLMQLETIDTADTTDPGEHPRQDIDDRAADAARMDVRRHEHSAD